MLPGVNVSELRQLKFVALHGFIDAAERFVQLRAVIPVAAETMRTITAIIHYASSKRVIFSRGSQLLRGELFRRCARVAVTDICVGR